MTNHRILPITLIVESPSKKQLNHNEHNEHNEKPGRLVSSSHPTEEWHALGKVSLLVVLVVVNWF
jgi:hypothetical protein